MKTKAFFPLLLLLISFSGLAQQSLQRQQKTLSATRVEIAPVIDGVPNERAWEDVPVAENFLMVDPGDGVPERESHPTKVKVVYDDEAVYIAAYMFDNEPKRILREFTPRDNIGQADFFLVDINTYNDGENQTRFIITSAGTLADARMKGESEDFSYDVVWEGKVSIDDKGWYAEIKIPYSALRFPEREEQIWSVQFIRQIKHLNEIYAWNYIDKSVGQSNQYNGLLTGIRNIDPPIRLSLYPYTSGEVDYFDGSVNTNLSAGMDIKYGISDAFTLDATLIPDFGQTAFDEVELNLSPFEQQFNENRAFFTEGTELFNKGNLFYSRRVGDRPIGFNSVQRQLLANEIVVKNPEQVRLLNALKLSGRTERALGVGFFNAITQETAAVIRDTVDAVDRTIVTEPLANYNIFVLDQQFNQNSSVTLINTNVLREGNFRDANVTGFLFSVANRANSYRFNGEAKVSQVNLLTRNKSGFASEFSVERTKGQIRYYAAHDFANETYDINDMGLNFINNYNNFNAGISYQIFEPTGPFNDLRINLNASHDRRYNPGVETGNSVGARMFAGTRNRLYFGGGVDYATASRDYFEPRVEGRFVWYNPNIGGETWVSTDYRKKLAFDGRFGFRDFFDSDRYMIRTSLSPRYRFSNEFTVIYEFEYRQTNNRDSFVDLGGREIIFGSRDTETVENSITASYNFNPWQGINLTFRNFWSAAKFFDNEFFRLAPDGNLEDTQYVYNSQNDPNANFNIWNLDLSYRWRFAPGSEAILLYRNSIFNLDNQSQLPYHESLSNLFMQPVRHNLSLRVVYFLDYNEVKNIFKS